MTYRFPPSFYINVLFNIFLCGCCSIYKDEKKVESVIGNAYQENRGDLFEEKIVSDNGIVRLLVANDYSKPNHYLYQFLQNGEVLDVGTIVTPSVPYKVAVIDSAVGKLIMFSCQPMYVGGDETVSYFRFFLTDGYQGEKEMSFIRLENSVGEFTRPKYIKRNILPLRPDRVTESFHMPMRFKEGKMLLDDHFNDSDSVILAKLIILSTEYIGFDNSYIGYHNLLTTLKNDQEFYTSLLMIKKRDNIWITEAVDEILETIGRKD